MTTLMSTRLQVESFVNHSAASIRAQHLTHSMAVLSSGDMRQSGSRSAKIFCVGYHFTLQPARIGHEDH